MSERKKPTEYHEGPEAAQRFERGVTRILSVSKEELERREYDYHKSREHLPRRGPKKRK